MALTHCIRHGDKFSEQRIGVGFEMLCKRFNHLSPAITMRYLGNEGKEVQNILMDEAG